MVTAVMTPVRRHAVLADARGTRFSRHRRDRTTWRLVAFSVLALALMMVFSLLAGARLAERQALLDARRAAWAERVHSCIERRLAQRHRPAPGVRVHGHDAVPRVHVRSPQEATLLEHQAMRRRRERQESGQRRVLREIVAYRHDRERAICLRRFEPAVVRLRHGERGARGFPAHGVDG